MLSNSKLFRCWNRRSRYFTGISHQQFYSAHGCASKPGAALPGLEGTRCLPAPALSSPAERPAGRCRRPARAGGRPQRFAAANRAEKPPAGRLKAAGAEPGGRRQRLPQHRAPAPGPPPRRGGSEQRPARSSSAAGAGRGTAAAHLLAPAPLRGAWRVPGQSPPAPLAAPSQRGSAPRQQPHRRATGHEWSAQRTAPDPPEKRPRPLTCAATRHTAPPAAAFKSAPPSGRACAARRSSRESSSLLLRRRRCRRSPW